MDKEKHCEFHFMVKTALKVATLATLVCGVSQLKRINHRLKKLGHCECEQYDQQCCKH